MKRTLRTIMVRLAFGLLWMTFSLMAWGQVENPTEAVSINDASVQITQAGTYTITGTGEVTGNNITVNTSETVNLTIENVNIESGGSPLNIESGDVKLTLRGTNRMIATGWNVAGIRVPEKASLEITKESEGHSLTAQGTQNDFGGAGIGANTDEIAGAITINGGNLDIIGGDCASAIGGGTAYNRKDIRADATSIIINGGTINAKKGNGAAVIGGGHGFGYSYNNTLNGKGGIIKITGGTIITDGTIGHEGDGSTTSITITGGSISASCSITPTSGSVNLEKKEITGLAAYAKVTALSGADGYSTEDMYADGNGKLYLWLPSDANPAVSESIAPVDIKVTINKDGAVWNDHGKTFSYKTEDGNVFTAEGFGKYYPEEDETYIVYDGENKTNAVVSKTNPDATLDYYTVTYDGNGATGGNVPTDDNIYLSGSKITPAGQGDLTKDYCTFKGWGTTNDATEPVGESFPITEKTTLYALWTLNTFTLEQGEIPTLTYGTAMGSVNFSAGLSDNAEADCGNIKFSVKDSGTLPDGLTLSEEGVLSGTPTAANEDGTEVTITATAENGSTAEAKVTIKVAKATPTVHIISPIDLVYNGEAKSVTSTVTGVEGEAETLKAEIIYYSDSEMTQEVTETINVGTYYVKAFFAGNNNYNSAEKTTQFTIAQATPESPETPSIEAAVTYGTKLNAITLPTGWTWADGETVPTVENSGYTAYYTVTDDTNYDWSKVEGWNGEMHRVERTVTVTVNPAEATLEYEETAITREYSDVPFTNPLTNESGVQVSYSSSDGTVATVDENGEVTIHAAGNTTITATVNDPNYEAEEAAYTLTVERADLPEGSEMEITGGDPDIEFSDENIDMTLTATVTGEGLGSDPSWKWSSDNEEVVRIPSTKTAETDTKTVIIVGPGTAKITATYTDSKYTGKVEFTVTVKEKEESENPDPEEPEEPVTPDPDPTPSDPDPTYYRVDLRPMEGVTIVPTSSVVEEGGTLTFTIEIEEGYVADSMRVTVSQGIGKAIEVEPDETCVYTVKNVAGLVTITVSGVREATTVGMEAIEGVRVYSHEGAIYVYTPTEKRVMVVAMNGVLKASEEQVGKRRYELPRGFYVVWVEGESFKVAN